MVKHSQKGTKANARGFAYKEKVNVQKQKVTGQQASDYTTENSGPRPKNLLIGDRPLKDNSLPSLWTNLKNRFLTASVKRGSSDNGEILEGNHAMVQTEQKDTAEESSETNTSNKRDKELLIAASGKKCGYTVPISLKLKEKNGMVEGKLLNKEGKHRGIENGDYVNSRVEKGIAWVHQIGVG